MMISKAFFVLFCLLLLLAGTLQVESQFTPALSPNVTDILITEEVFDEMLTHRDDIHCPSRGFYTYQAFLEAASSFPGFGSTGDLDTRKREIAAFFAQTSFKTRGGWPFHPKDEFTWGYCYNEDPVDRFNYCVPIPIWPCVPGKMYYGRGPFNLQYNVDYAQAGEVIGYDLLSDPDAVANDPVISFKTAFWYWMTPQPTMPALHDVMTGLWTPSGQDLIAARLPGFGLTTNIIDDSVCGCSYLVEQQFSRINYYRRYCDILGVNPGDHLDCHRQLPFDPPASGVSSRFGSKMILSMTHSAHIEIS